MNKTPGRNIQDGDKNPLSVFQKKKKRKIPDPRTIGFQTRDHPEHLAEHSRVHGTIGRSFVRFYCGGGRLCSSREERAPLEAGNRIGRVKLSKFPIGGPEIPRPLIDLTDRIRPTLAILLGVIAWKRGCRLFFLSFFFSLPYPLSREKNPLLCVRISRFYIGRTGVTASGRNAIEARRMEASLQSCPRLFTRGLAGFVFEEILIERNRDISVPVLVQFSYTFVVAISRYLWRGFSCCVKSEVPSCILPCN